MNKTRAASGKRKAEYTVVTDLAMAKIRAGITSVRNDEGITNCERLLIFRQLRDEISAIMCDVATTVREADARAAAPELFSGEKYKAETKERGDPK